jgi:predicted O-methyltransferase YrrM
VIYSSLRFIQHYVSATFIDVLHSPFVFELYNDCIARKPYPKELSGVDAAWKQALRNTTTIEQTDFGAKGHLHPIVTKPVNHFARLHAKPKRVAQVLYNLIQKYQYQNCIELGTSLGYSTMHLATPLPPNAIFTTIEGAKEIAQVATSHFEAAHLSEKINQVVGQFDHVLPGILDTYPTVDFAFIDGNHTYQATLDYFKLFLKKKNNNSVFVFDDIYWSKGMTKAWEEIKAHPDVTLTVDLYFIGLVYFRTEQRKQHFKLRLF